jgi:hypothetical protein
MRIRPGWSVLTGLAVLIAGCAQPTGGGGTQSQGAPSPATASAPKTMTLAIQTEPKGFLIDYTLETVGIGGIAQPVQVVHNFLAINNGMDVWLPQLAVDLPSIEKSTWSFQPDGTMEPPSRQTTWCSPAPSAKTRRSAAAHGPTWRRCPR